jgi:hypothetical protein
MICWSSALFFVKHFFCRGEHFEYSNEHPAENDDEVSLEREQSRLEAMLLEHGAEGLLRKGSAVEPRFHENL